MPRQTFHNLPPDKRARFVDAALDQFARLPYDQASITALIASLGIAKGSFYQYFDDKFDLFTWLLSEAGARKQQGSDQAMAQAGTDFFGGLRLGYAAGLRLWREDPRLAAVSLQLNQPSREPRLQALRRQVHAHTSAWLAEQLARGQRDGQVRTDLDLGVMTALVQATLSEGLLGALLARAGTDLDAVLQEPERLAAVGEADLEQVIDQALAYLRGAIGVR